MNGLNGQIIAMYGVIESHAEKLFLITKDGQKVLLTSSKLQDSLRFEVGAYIIASGKFYIEESQSIMFVDHFERIKSPQNSIQSA